MHHQLAYDQLLYNEEDPHISDILKCKSLALYIMPSKTGIVVLSHDHDYNIMCIVTGITLSRDWDLQISCLFELREQGFFNMNVSSLADSFLPGSNYNSNNSSIQVHLVFQRSTIGRLKYLGTSVLLLFPVSTSSITVIVQVQLSRQHDP